MDTKMTAAQYEVACYIEDLCSFVRQYAPAFLKPFFASYSFNVEGNTASKGCHISFGCHNLTEVRVVKAFFTAVKEQMSPWNLYNSGFVTGHGSVWSITDYGCSFNEGTAAHPEYACITIWATSVISEQEAA